MCYLLCMYFKCYIYLAEDVILNRPETQNELKKIIDDTSNHVFEMYFAKYICLCKSDLTDKMNAVTSKQRSYRYCYMDALHRR